MTPSRRPDLLRPLSARTRRGDVVEVRGWEAGEFHNQAVPFVVLREAPGGRQESAAHLGQRELANLQRGQALALISQPRSQEERARSKDRELPKQSPWLNAIEPKWIHGKRKVTEPERSAWKWLSKKSAYRWRKQPCKPPSRKLYRKTNEFVASHSTMPLDPPTTAPSPRPPAHRIGVPLRDGAPGGLPPANSWAGSGCAGSG